MKGLAGEKPEVSPRPNVDCPIPSRAAVANSVAGCSMYIDNASPLHRKMLLELKGGLYRKNGHFTRGPR